MRSCPEREDGNGYPNGLARESIAIEVQIVACWDAFNAMATDRPHRAARSLDELRTKHDTHLDPQVFDCLLGLHDSAARCGRLARPAAR